MNKENNNLNNSEKPDGQLENNYQEYKDYDNQINFNNNNPDKSSENDVSTDNKEEDVLSDKFIAPPGSFKEKLHMMKQDIYEQLHEIIIDYKEDSAYKKKERQKEFYGGRPPKSKKSKALFILFYIIKKFFSVAATTVFSIFLIFIITGTIVGTVATIYILGFMDTTQAVPLKEEEQSFASYIYVMNKAKNDYDLAYKVMPASHDVRISIELSDIPDYVKYAFVCTEDERFYSHEGVDYKRTGAAVVNLALSQIGMSDQYFGGSTITQQLVKNITGDDRDTWDRKMNEIFTSMKFEKKYTKDEILQSYLNTIYFGQIETYNMYGIEAASIGYYGKSASELTIAEVATLAALPKAPNEYNIAYHYEDNMKRKEYCLSKMFKLGVITSDQYEEAMNQQILVTTMPEFKAKYPTYTKLTESDEDFQNPEINSWAVDTAIVEFGDYLREQNELETIDEGVNMFNTGGYKLYLTVDSDVQAHLDSTYADWTNFPESLSDQDEKIQSALAVMDYRGHILGVAGQIGPKTGNLGWNNAYDTHRQPGSTIKPVSTYGYAIENDKITWSTYFYDLPLPKGEASTEEWPNNYDGKPSGGYYPVNYFLKRSINTLPAQIANKYGLKEIYDFATKKMHLQLDPDLDMNYSPLCVGGTAHGPSVINLANAYIPYGNGGTYYKASMIKKAVDCKSGETIFDNDEQNGQPAVSAATAEVMNKLLQKVITNGTGTAAQLSNTTLAGKTGTTEDWRDITFVGLTPDFVSALWVGYSNGTNADAIRNSNSASIWFRVFGTYANAAATGNKFPECGEDEVIYARYCSSTGLLANPGCPGGDYGWYKKSKCEYCKSH